LVKSFTKKLRIGFAGSNKPFFEKALAENPKKVKAFLESVVIMRKGLEYPASRISFLILTDNF